MNGKKIISLGEPVSDYHAARQIDIKSVYCVKEGTLNFSPSSLTLNVIQYNQQIILKPPKVIIFSFDRRNGNRGLT